MTINDPVSTSIVQRQKIDKLYIVFLTIAPAEQTNITIKENF
jgi:hypothetical protein